MKKQYVMTEKQREASVKIIQNICSLVVEVGVCIVAATRGEEAVPKTKSYARGLVDGLNEFEDDEAEG